MKSKWEIEHDSILLDSDRKKYWEHTHAVENYETVWSLTDDIEVREKIIDALSSYEDISKILIPGCGSKVLLQNEIADRFPKSLIVCSDYQGVIDIAKKKESRENIGYMALDSTNLGFENEWDVVIIVNSILSESHIENRDILKSCYRALKQDGVLLGFFPTIFASVDIAYLESEENMSLSIDLTKSSFYEKKQKIWQIFYTPLRLRYLLKEVNFIRDKMEIFFCDSEYFTAHSKEYYGIEDVDLPVYELFVIAYK